MLTLIPSERGVNTQEERTRDWVQKRGMWDICLPALSLIPSVCDQPVAGSSWEIPLYLSEASLLITAFISLGFSCCFALFSSFESSLSPLHFPVSVSQTLPFGPCSLSLAHLIPLLLITHSSFLLSHQWLTGTGLTGNASLLVLFFTH